MTKKKKKAEYRQIQNIITDNNYQYNKIKSSFAVNIRLSQNINKKLFHNITNEGYIMNKSRLYRNNRIYGRIFFVIVSLSNFENNESRNKYSKYIKNFDNEDFEIL